MQALVTGASGFLGRYIVEQCVARGDRVRALCRAPDAQLEALGVEVVLGDIRDRSRVIAACKAQEVALHVAGLADIWGTWTEFFSINTQGTANVLAGCRRHGVGRMVLTSTASVTFAGRDQCGVDERAAYPTRWLCHYSHSKALAEQLVLSANGEPGLLTCALRPHLIWGPRDRHLFPRIVARQRAGKLKRIGSGKNLIDTVYVENAAAAHLAAADGLQPGSVVAGRPYFITQGEPVNCWEWIDRLLDVAGLPPVRGRVSAAAAYAAGAAMEVTYRALGRKAEPAMTRFLAAQLSQSHYFDISAARRDLNYEPTVSTDEGLRRLRAALAECDANPSPAARYSHSAV